MQVLDYSRGYPGAQAIIAKNYGGAVRYLRKEGTSIIQPLTVTEVNDFETHDLTLALIYQHTSRSRPLDGRPAGQHDAQWARTRAAEVGLADPRCIYFTTDFDASVAQYPIIQQYYLGAADVMGNARIGAYGEYGLLDYLFTHNSITWGWQTYAWSPGHNHDNEPRHPRAHLFQRLGSVSVGGVTCDVNDVLKSDFGQVLGYAGQTEGSDMEAMEPVISPITGESIGPFKDVTFYTNLYANGIPELKSMLATVIANQEDDLNAADVMTHLADTYREAINDTVLPALRAALDAALGEHNVENVAEIRDAVLDGLSARLRPAE